MGRYGITIKNPNFEGIGYYWKDDNLDSLKEYFMLDRAKLASFALKEKPEQYINTNSLAFLLRSIKQYLIILSIKKFKSWVDEDKLYLDYVKINCSKWEIEDIIKDYEEFINDDLEELAIYALLPSKLLLNEEDKDYRKSIIDVINCVRCDIDNIIHNMEETIDTYVSYKLALLNFDNIVKKEELIEENEE